MRYFLDTEFIEDGKTIELISIGLVAEDGREYYAISSDFDESRANDWVKGNVLPYLPAKLVPTSNSCGCNDCKAGSVVYAEPWKPRSKIKNDVLEMVGTDPKPQFWGYYSAYDWVVFCQLFGRMVDLPRGFPMYCRDIKQLADILGNPRLPVQKQNKHHALHDALWNKTTWEYLNTVSRL